ncbi:hypothetical protein ACFYS8_13300 [Kitasatospora sp. NPDC004615]|uniref:hypothetical protein n=1 Tax=Kitasatospora sp. NPDC004615 TaxID=3364017 RepID=UPI0036A9CA90
MTTNQPTARQELLDELLTGEDPSAPEYPDAFARLDGLVVNHTIEVRNQTLAEAADIASNEGMRLEAEVGIEPARGARVAAAHIRRATSAGQAALLAEQLADTTSTGMTVRQPNPREALEILLPDFMVGAERTRLLDNYRDQVREEVAAEIDAAAERTLTEYPDAPAMSARVLGLRAAARIARAVQKG